jgi:membrane fusion protein (multidrug efflux system)
MKKPLFILLALLAGLAVAAVLGGLKYFQIQKMIAEHASFVMPPSSVTSLVADEAEWIPTLRAVGSTAAVQGVVVSTDQPGIVTKINFESGHAVKAGDLLVQLDITQEEAQLHSALAHQKLAALNLQRQKNLLQGRVSAQADYDAAQAEYDQATSAVLEAQSRLSKKTIRAPFSGVLGIRQVNLGQYLKSGAEIAPLQSLDPIYVNFWLPQQNLAQIRAGQKVRVHADGLPETFEGAVNAVDSVVDETTRNIRVQATLPNPQGLLRAGMFVNTEIPLPTKERHVVLPATSVQYAPYGDSVFVIEPAKDAQSPRTVRQQVVKIGESLGDKVTILEGVKAGEEVVTSGGFKLRQGSPVVVNNTIVPPNDTKPNPEDS